MAHIPGARGAVRELLSTCNYGLLTVMLSIEPHKRGAEGDDGRVALDELVIAGGNASKLFEAAEEALDAIAVFVDRTIVAASSAAISARQDHRHGLPSRTKSTS